MTDHLTELNDSVDLPGIIAELYPESGAIPGRRATVYAVWRGNKNTPAFSLFKEGSTWFWSDKGNSGLNITSGNAYQFLTEIHNLDSNEAIEYLERKTGIGKQKEQFRTRSRKSEDTISPAFCLNKPLELEVIQKYRDMYNKDSFAAALTGRGLTMADVRNYGLINSNGDVIIPIKNPDGNLTSFKRRYNNPPLIHGKPMRYKVETENNGTPAWTSPNFKELSDTTGNVMIVEGELNAIAFDSTFNQASAKKFGGVLGLQGKDSGVYRGSLAGKNVYLYLDKVDNFDHIVSRYVEAAKSDGARNFYVLETFDKDFCEMNEMSKETFYSVVDKAIINAKRLYTDTDRPVGNMDIKSLLVFKDFLLDDTKPKITHPYGFIELDNKTFGMFQTGINLFAALSGQGKSTFLRQVMLQSIDREPIKLYTSDESADLICIKMATYLSGIPFEVIINNTPFKTLIDKYKTMKAIKTAWSEAYDYFLLELTKRFKIMSTNKVEVIIDDMIKESNNGTKLFAVDYVQDLKLGGKRDDDMTMSLLKETAFQNNFAILLGAQLAKYKFTHDRVSGFPVVGDIDGAGAIFQHSETALFAYHQDMYMKMFALSPEWYRDYTTDLHGRARIFVHKSRLAGLSDVDLRFMGEVNTYKSLIDDGSGEVRI